MSTAYNLIFETTDNPDVVRVGVIEVADSNEVAHLNISREAVAGILTGLLAGVNR